MKDRTNQLLAFGIAALLTASGVAFGQQSDRDNSRVNKRDRRSTEVTADQQGQSKSDIELTQKIRRAIRDDKALSMDAKNIKIITNRGMVTLKGPVRSEREKAAIQAKAAALAGDKNIKNQIDVNAVQGTRRGEPYGRK